GRRRGRDRDRRRVGRRGEPGADALALALLDRHRPRRDRLVARLVLGADAGALAVAGVGVGDERRVLGQELGEVALALGELLLRVFLDLGRELHGELGLLVAQRLFLALEQAGQLL